MNIFMAILAVLGMAVLVGLIAYAAITTGNE